MSCNIYTVNPLEDRRWPELVERHPKASVFHSLGWLKSLNATYGYEPVAFTTSEPGGDLRDAVVFCVIRSWLTGRRLVSLPFSDHCEPLVENSEELNELLHFVEHLRKRENWKYVELRPAAALASIPAAFRESQSFCLHVLNLNPDLNVLLESFHKNCVQRKIRKSEREGLEYESGRTESQLQKLYGLLKLTRRRHAVPPQPIEWFRNVLNHCGDSARIHIAALKGVPVAGILTLSQGKRVVYKYGGSDTHTNNLGGMPLLFWKSIQEAKSNGADEFDFGRSDLDNPGLIAFKEHWAASRQTLTYLRSRIPGESIASSSWQSEVSRKVFTHLPDVMQEGVGRLIYRHIG